MEQNNAVCSICGNSYRICNSCVKHKNIRSWRTVVDSMEHYKIYLAIHGYTLSGNKEKARKELKNCDLSGSENFNPEIRAAIKEILGETGKSGKTVETVEKERT